ncbi:hypothetical protein [Kribbella alba]
MARFYGGLLGPQEPGRQQTTWSRPANTWSRPDWGPFEDLLNG